MNEQIERVHQIISNHHKSQERLIQILLELQELSGRHYVPKEWEPIVAGELGLPLCNVHDVVTFYDMFATEPQGKHLIEVCKSGPCHVNKPKGMIASFEKTLGVKMGETTKDGLFTLKYASCFGGCEVSPAVKIGQDIHGQLDEQKIEQLIMHYRGV